MFKRRRFPVEIILLCVRWNCKYGISYRDLVEMMQERGVDVDPSTLMRWVHRYAPEFEKRVRWNNIIEADHGALKRIIRSPPTNSVPTRKRSTGCSARASCLPTQNTGPANREASHI
jgi:transposase-like protein